MVAAETMPVATIPQPTATASQRAPKASAAQATGPPLLGHRTLSSAKLAPVNAATSDAARNASGAQ